MKKLVLAGLLLGSSVSLMADYVAGYMRCDHISGNGATFFMVKGKGNNLRSGNILAMSDFLNGDYASETNDHCIHHQVFVNGMVFSYKSKSDANRQFSSLLNDYKNESYVKKLIIIREGYDEADWI